MDAVAACQDFINQREPRQIAAQLRVDSALCRAGKRPSFLALLLPHSSTELAKQISKHLAADGHGESHELPEAVRELWYTGLVDGIKSYLSTLSVIEYINLGADKGDIVGNPDGSAHPREDILHSRQRRELLCYICRFTNHKPHSLTPSLCEACGSFNLANSLISLPGSWDLCGKIAVVTGGRVNLGFATALRLLRCGAKVIISSRYPQDAETRYLAERDSGKWISRLRIIGADFRTARDAFSLVEVVKRQIALWTEAGRLDILINNAAQTLTDSIRQEAQAIERERCLIAQYAESTCVVGKTYEARIRGGNGPGWESSLQWHGNPEIGDKSEECKNHIGSLNIYSDQPSCLSSSASSKHPPDTVETALKSSWVQSLNEIPYEDLVTAHSVNFFVPLILCRELLPLMGRRISDNNAYDADTKLPKTQEEQSCQSDQNLSDRKTRIGRTNPLGYIINVSSREGLFEKEMGAEAKNGKHVHTNTSKAALNMITETEADLCWRSRKVAMNTVDPGYMSAAPEMQVYGDCPITFEDGAARVLWPIAVAERDGKSMYGRFFKHFGAVEVEVGAGR